MRMVVSADLHLREDRPRCRKDENWIVTQEKALNQLCHFCVKNNCNLFLVGDIFNSAHEYRMVIYIQKIAIKLFKFGLHLYYIWGNHDCLYHNGVNFYKSAIGLLKNSINCFPIKNYFVENGIDDFSAGNFDEETDNKKFIFKHVLCFPDMKSLPPNVDAMTAKDLLEEYTNAQWIFTGDYHKNFHYEKNGRHVVNPGCLLRQAVDFKNYQPGFYFIDTDKNIVEFNLIIDSEEFIDDSYILREKEKEERIEAFANKIGEVESVSLDYAENVRAAISTSNLSDELVETIEELMGA